MDIILPCRKLGSQAFLGSSKVPYSSCECSGDVDDSSFESSEDMAVII